MTHTNALPPKPQHTNHPHHRPPPPQSQSQSHPLPPKPPRTTHISHAPHRSNPSDLSLDPDPDSDYPLPTTEAAPPPLSPSQQGLTNDALNHRVLQRYLPSLQTIVFLANYVVIYHFSAVTQSWEKSGIEGSLFVVRLSTTSNPVTTTITTTNTTTTSIGRDGEEDEGEEGGAYTIFVLNRRGLENFALGLGTVQAVDVEGEYIIVRAGRGEGTNVHGLWVFEEEMGSTQGVRARCAQCIMECWKGNDDDGGGGEGIGVGEERRNGVGLEQKSPDLMAFLGQPRAQPEQVAPQAQPQQRDVLGDLFRKAGEDLRY